VRGADANALEAKIKQHYVVPEGTGDSALASSVNGYPDITSNIDVKNVELPGMSLISLGGMFKPEEFASGA
jgi:hypothetical protein